MSYTWSLRLDKRELFAKTRPSHKGQACHFVWSAAIIEVALRRSLAVRMSSRVKGLKVSPLLHRRAGLPDSPIPFVLVQYQRACKIRKSSSIKCTSASDEESALRSFPTASRHTFFTKPLSFFFFCKRPGKRSSATFTLGRATLFFHRRRRQR